LTGSDDPRNGEGLEEFERALGHRFRDRQLLEIALQHSSYANEAPDRTSNERLEFLGDAVIGLVVAQLLYRAQPDWQEGELTRGLHRLVDKQAFAALARRLDLGSQLRLGRTEQQSAGAEKDSILANAMEAVVGALYLDAGLPAVETLVQAVYGKALSTEAPPTERDVKTRLQEAVMARHGEFPDYELEFDSGIEGDEERFGSRVLVCGEVYGRGVGRTKRAAEFKAARAAWPRIAEESEADA